MIVLENDLLRVEFKTVGAELTRIYSKKNGLDYLWRVNENFWTRYAPVLFPIVGRLKDHTYTVDGQKYLLSQHGFARDLSFSISSKSNSEVVFLLTHSQKTLENYPFKFALEIHYRLEEDTLQVSYYIKNKDTKDLYFSIGGHPGFTCPLTPDTQFSDYYIEFEQEENPKQHLLNSDNGLRKVQPEEVHLEKNIPLSYELFSKDALIYEGIKSKRISLKSTKHNHGFHFTMNNWQFLAFWTKKNAPFICFEPWMGAADLETSNQKLEDKDSMLRISEHQSYSNSYSITFF